MTVEKPWGKYKLLLNSPFLKVKELIVYPGKTLSRQRHFFRSEIWFCSEGVCQVEIDNTFFTLTQNDKVVSINKEQWHRLSNPNKDVCKIIEVQYGEKCIEEDIERQI
jgi:mannose-6-phosphate isomerase-like protein (cupin superfamily)